MCPINLLPSHFSEVLVLDPSMRSASPVVSASQTQRWGRFRWWEVQYANTLSRDGFGETVLGHTDVKASDKCFLSLKTWPSGFGRSSPIGELRRCQK